MGNFIGWVIFLLVALAIIVAVLAWFYQRATREVSLVKTGLGGRRVVLDGGVIAIPWFTEVARVNMQSLRLEVRRSGDAALITKDRMRVDIGAEFHVSVGANEEAIARAVQTLGRRTFHPDQLRELIEGKLVDALRAVAARITMDELHEGRGAFVAEVRDALSDALARNGLELDAVSLTALDQTPFDALDENNAFNAVGMRKLAEVIATSKKERAQIDADAEVAVRKAAMRANKLRLEIDLEEQEAQIAQQQQVETLKADQLAEVARRKAAGEQAAAHARISMEQEIRTADIARERTIREAEIAKEQQLQVAEIARERDLAIANQEREIAVAIRSQEENKARAEADTSRAQAVQAAESVTTARQVAEAERRKAISALAVLQEAENQATRLRLEAESQKAAAGDRAEARRIESEALKRARLAEAEANRAAIDADNTQSDSLMAHKLDLARLEALPGVLAEVMRPAEKIDSIRINHLSGLGHGGAEGTRPVVNQALDSILEMAVQLPALKKLGEQVGLSLDEGIAGLTEGGLGGSGKQARKPDA